MNSPTTPQWWQSLTEDASAQSLGITWRAPDEWEPPEEDSSAGTLNNQDTRRLDARIREGKLLVGTGPSVTMRGLGIDVDAHWYLDPDEPERLWCALGHFYDPRLWIPVEPNPDALSEVLSSSHPKPGLRNADLPGFVRGFLGFRQEVSLPNVYSGEMVPFNGLDLDRYTTMMRYLEQSSWASSWQQDPYQDDFEAMAPLVLGAYEREHRLKAQRLGWVPSMSWRTLHSRSILSFEIHARALVCAAVRYRPTPKSHHPVVERINSALNLGYPVDLPLDVVGALTCMDFQTADDLAHLLDEPESDQHLATAIQVFGALWHGDLRSTLRLREFAGHTEPSVRHAVLRVAADYNYRFLIEEVMLTTTDPESLEQLEEYLVVGTNPDNYNAFGDDFAGQQPVMIDKEGNPVEVLSDFIGDGDPGEDGEEDEDDEDEGKADQA